MSANKNRVNEFCKALAKQAGMPTPADSVAFGEDLRQLTKESDNATVQLAAKTLTLTVWDLEAQERTLASALVGIQEDAGREQANAESGFSPVSAWVAQKAEKYVEATAKFNAAVEKAQMLASLLGASV